MHTTILGLTEESFWHTTPRKLEGLYSIYLTVNNLDGEKDLAIDDVMF